MQTTTMKKTTLFFEFLDSQKAKTEAGIISLANDGRKDESNILKAKANIYGICKAVYNAALKSNGEEGIAVAFLPAFEKITSQWTKSLEAAKAHNDSHKVMIEESKMAAVAEIVEKFQEIF